MIQPISDEQEAFFRGAEAALLRAAQYALELGQRTHTPVYVLRDGKIIDLLAPAAASRSFSTTDEQ